MKKFLSKLLYALPLAALTLPLIAANCTNTNVDNKENINNKKPEPMEKMAETHHYLN